MKIFVTGNCQARPLSTFLDQGGTARTLEPAILHTATPADAAQHLARMDEADLILAQLTYSDFQPGHLASQTIRARHPDKTLIWPNLFHTAQQPWLRYVTHARGGRIMGPLDAYHDLRLLGAWYQARIGQDPFADLDVAAAASGSLAALQSREAGCDVTLSDLIAAEQDRRILFFSFNHPARWLLLQLAARIAARIGRPFDAAAVPGAEPLDRIIAPSTWHERPFGGAELPKVRGPDIVLGTKALVSPGPPVTRDPERLRALSFACYDQQAELLLDGAGLRLTPPTPMQLPPVAERRIAVPAAPVPTAQIRTIHESDHLVVHLHDRGGPLLAVTFGGSGDRPAGDRIWAGAPLQKLGLSGLGFTAKASNWYPARAMAEAIAALTAQGILAAFPRRIGYGTSMGGYAVMRYGAQLGLQAGFAFAPQISIDPRDITDPRFNPNFDPDLHAGMRIPPGSVTFPMAIAFDPLLPIDARHVAQIAAENAVTCLPAPGAGHMVARLGAGSDKLRALIEALDRGDFTGLNRHLRAWRRERPSERALRLCMPLAARHPAMALRMFKAHCGAMAPAQWPELLFPLCRAGLGDHLTAELALALAARPDHPMIHLALAVSLQRQRNFDAALAHAERAQSLRPGAFGAFLLGQIQKQRAGG